jgi:hypothetical protein
MADNNTAVGINSLTAITTNGADNAALGASALAATTSGTQNVGVGSQAGSTNTTGGSNILIGYNANALTASTSNYLNIGGTIKGDMSIGPIILNTGINFQAKTQSPGDNTPNLATTAFVTSAVGGATGALVKIAGSHSFDTNTSNLIDFSSSGLNVPVDTYSRLELVLSNVKCTTAALTDGLLVLYFVNQGTRLTSSVYSDITANGGAGNTPPTLPPQNVLVAPYQTNIVDGSGEILLRNFCRSSTTIYPSADLRLSTIGPGGGTGESCYGTYLCGQVATTAFDGLYFLDSNVTPNRWQFSWELYGLLI